MRIRLVLTGGRAGHTGLLGKFRFVDGIMEFEGDAKAITGICTYMARVYQAYPEGSEELRHGNGTVSPPAGTAEPVQGGSVHEQSGSASKAADDGGGTTDPQAGPASGTSPSRDRYADARLDRIREAVMTLDNDNDDHWSADGLPRVDVIATMAGDPSIRRKDVTQAVPDLSRKK